MPQKCKTQTAVSIGPWLPEVGAGVVGTPRKMLTEKEVLALMGFARSTLRRLVDRQEFPQPLEISPNRIAYLDDEVAEWQRNKIKQRELKAAA